MAKKKTKIRAQFRKKHESRSRASDLTRDFRDGQSLDDTASSERLTGKGHLTRKKTIVGTEIHDDAGGLAVQPDIDLQHCQRGRVLSIHGLASEVLLDDGRRFRCAIRQLLKSLSTDQRNVVTVGDHVWVRPANDQEAFIERIEPRHGVISRTSRGRQHVIVSNVDQLVIVTSASEPTLKPNLIDRFLVTAERNQIPPVICINKVDLIDPADLQPLVGGYGQMGYAVLLVSAETGFGIERFRRALQGRQTVLSGQSGVGKSSLLNMLDEGLNLRVARVSSENNKGRHTTTATRLIPLSMGGFVVDTPGVRQFQLWDVIPAEVAGFFRDIRPYVNRCRYPDCTHTHESDCAVKDGVAYGQIDVRRYESYCYLFQGDT